MVRQKDERDMRLAPLHTPPRVGIDYRMDKDLPVSMLIDKPRRSFS
jgi:hypothetical protein